MLTKAGALTRDGNAVRDPATKVKGDERYTLALPDPEPAHNEPQEIPLPIVYEDEHLLVVDKPAGLVVTGGGQSRRNLVNALLHHCGGSLSGIGGVARPGIVHRIDKDTSGLLVVAKHDKAHEGLAKQFATHSIDRRYLAIVSGVPRQAEGIVDAPLARRAEPKKIAIVKPAWKTRRNPLDAAGTSQRCRAGRMPAGPAGPIRVRSMASIGHPLVGDPVYGAEKRSQRFAQSIGLQAPGAARSAPRLYPSVTKGRLSFDTPFRRTCRNCSTHLVYRINTAKAADRRPGRGSER